MSGGRAFSVHEQYGTGIERRRYLAHTSFDSSVHVLLYVLETSNIHSSAPHIVSFYYTYFNAFLEPLLS